MNIKREKRCQKFAYNLLCLLSPDNKFYIEPEFMKFDIVERDKDWVAIIDSVKLPDYKRIIVEVHQGWADIYTTGQISSLPIHSRISYFYKRCNILLFLYEIYALEVKRTH